MGFLIAQGEAINGSVYSFDKKLPILEANISVKESNLGTTTNESGEFSIELDTTNDIALLISMMGYKDTTIAIKHNQTRLIGRIYLKPLVIELNQIHVDSHKDLYKSKSQSSISIFGNKFQKSVKGDLATTLNGESGLAVRSSGQATQRPILRSYSGDRFLITKDGIELGDLSNSTADHAVGMEISTVESVEILRGPETLIYGSNTIAGVINLSPLASNEEKLKNPEYKFIFGHEQFLRLSFFTHFIC